MSAFSTFANEGVHTDPIFVTRIEDRQGNVIANFIPQSQDAVSEAHGLYDADDACRTWSTRVPPGG